MLLAIDIGNTNITLGVFRGNRLIKRYAHPTKNKHYFAYLQHLVTKNKIDDAIICSVVPIVTRRLEKDLKKLLGKSPYIIAKNIKVPIKNLYRKPKQVGGDRLVNAYAAIRFYKKPVVVVDFGTAVTFDIISKKGEYLGGMILPGLNISLEALNQRTALLPKIKLARPREFIGRDTKNSMLSGIVYGFAAVVDNLAQALKAKLGAKTKVIGTGGDINLIAKYCQQLDKVDSHLTLKGLNLIYNNR